MGQLQVQRPVQHSAAAAAAAAAARALACGGALHADEGEGSTRQDTIGLVKDLRPYGVCFLHAKEISILIILIGRVVADLAGAG
jgi:hypothetical protein